MLCSNKGCGIKVDEIGKLCNMCHQCSSLDSHDCEKYIIYIINRSKCYACEENKKIRCPCGEERVDNHRLCKTCIKAPSCFSCDGKIDVGNDYIKHCHTCLLKSKICSYIYCEEKLYGNYCCKQHCCKNTNCLNIINGESRFCSTCTCVYLNCSGPKTNGTKTKNSRYCIKHKCVFDHCEEYVDCPIHKCSFSGCSKPSVKNSLVCIKHICSLCTESVASFFSNRQYSLSISNFCESHKCKYDRCCLKRHKQGEFCLEHSCAVKDCKKITFDFVCNDHSSDTVCKKWHGNSRFKNCTMMIFAECLRKKIPLDMELALKKLSMNPKVTRFLTYFRKTGAILTYKLKIENFPKDIRRMIYYEYLKQTVIHYFSKYCYGCVEICKETCSKELEFQWPGNINCETHYCDVIGCTKVRHKESEYCVEHKCGECNNLSYKDKKYCNNHLCPLCRTKPCIGKKRYCNRCNCRKYIPTYGDYNHKRCKNPKHNGIKFCIDHQ